MWLYVPLSRSLWYFLIVSGKKVLCFDKYFSLPSRNGFFFPPNSIPSEAKFTCSLSLEVSQNSHVWSLWGRRSWTGPGDTGWLSSSLNRTKETDIGGYLSKYETNFYLMLLSAGQKRGFLSIFNFLFFNSFIVVLRIFTMLCKHHLLPPELFIFRNWNCTY